ncbi:sugar-binding domain-containing protein [Opitutus sp. ER46]|uniref:glycoside hydrolase family 2 protein n=1 Tax=Opitutus sp. ER46 TaxID=2161864 RepID=UPI000D316D64|nr:sugar-binding domain-containing protein [Opitutus sp. ER46]PTX94499.1 glycoside hydrolase family 2 [Opitutus sp. ER46]
MRPPSLARFVAALFSASLVALTSTGTPTPASAPVPAATRLTLNFNPDWRFLQADAPGAEAPAFDDRAWVLVSAPHTFNDVDTFDNWSTPGHRGEQLQWSGLSWYRKSFTAPAAWMGRRVVIEFEAVRQIAEVFCNGHRLGAARSGFTPFGFDLTPHLRFDAPNVVAVRVDNRFFSDPLDPATAAEIARRNGTAAKPRLSSTANPNLRDLSQHVNAQIPENVEDLRADQIPWNNPHWHPAHGGLYRNVRLIVTDPLHIDLPLFSFLQTTGPYAYASDISPARANVTVEVPVTNGRSAPADAEVEIQVHDAAGRLVLTARDSRPLPAGGSAVLQLSGVIAEPRLWEPADPHVYRVHCALAVAGQPVDTAEVPLGIRTVRWDAAQGVFINGRHLKLHGWGQKPTDEWPGLGAALPNWLHAETLALMQRAGGNFVRWGHAAAGPAQIAAADALGLVTLQPGVDGESDTVRAAWTLRAQAFRDVLIYFRNHPSILIWEGGNQKVSREHGAELRALMDKYDPHGGRAYAHRRADRITAEFMDVGIGTEGGREIADLPVVEGEYDREESPRRVWDNASPPNFGYPEAKGMTYQLTSEQFAVNQITHFKKISPPEHCGGANWIFSDSTSGGRVPAEVARASGEVDGVRLPKEAYFVSAVLFRDDPQVHLIGHWTYPAGTRKNIYVAANAEEVELLLNGKSLGRAQPTDTFLFTFPNVTFAPGELKAVARRGGQIVATHALRTAGAPVALRLTAITAPGGWRADGQDIALVDVEAVDADGNRCPTFQQRVDFTTTGPAVWRGGYNSGKQGSINHPFLDLESGINRVALRATRTAGPVVLQATSAGLRPAEIVLEPRAFSAPDGLTVEPPATPAFPLPATAPAHPEFAPAPALQKPTANAARASAGSDTLIRRFAYTGPHAEIVHVERGARDGKIAYVDRDATFRALPQELVGADWIQVAQADTAYSAVDLIELALPAGVVVTIAHDAALPRPTWLTQQFQPTGHTLELNGRPMTLFARTVAQDASLTLGANTDAAPVPAANMYLVFVRRGSDRTAGSPGHDLR